MQIAARQRAPWAHWQEYAHEITAAFSAITEEEQARKQLKGLTQTASVQNYIQRFHDLKLHIPSMFVADTFAQFMDGLKPAIQQEIAPHVTTLVQAQTMVTKVDLYTAHGGKAKVGSSSSGNSGGRGGGRSVGRKGKLGVVEENPQQELAMTIAEKKS